MQNITRIGKLGAKSAKKRKTEIEGKKSVQSMDMSFLLLVFILLGFGLLMVFSASYANALYYEGDSLYFIKRQGFFAVIGIIVMLVTSRFDYKIYKKYAPFIYAFGILLLVLVFVPGISYARNGVHRWINFGFATFQPSEFAKFAIIIVFASIISANSDRMKKFKYGMLPFGIVLLPVFGLLALEPHLSGLILITLIAVIMMFVGGTNLKHFAVIGGIGVGLLIIMLLVMSAKSGEASFLKGYQLSRIQNWLNPFENEDLQGEVWQTCQSLLAIGSGGFMGLGFGNSREKYLYLPEPQNDFIFAIVCEELGLIGALLVIILFGLLVYRGFAIANKAPNKFAAMVVIGITLQIGLQTLLNIAVVTNSIPNTGISLPFFSYGGTALVMQLFEMGVVLNISRHSKIDKP